MESRKTQSPRVGQDIEIREFKELLKAPAGARL